MKFEKEFDQDHVPEWRDKYLEYKTGKKLIKALQRAISRTQGVSDPRAFFTSHLPGALTSRNHGYHTTNRFDDDDSIPLRKNAAGFGVGSDKAAVSEAPGSRIIRNDATTHSINDGDNEVMRNMLNTLYDKPTSKSRVTFEAPGYSTQPLAEVHSSSPARDNVRRSLRPLDVPAELPKTGDLQSSPTQFKFSRVATTKIESHTHPIEMLRLRERELMTFLNSELNKVDRFFQSKEKAAGQRLEALREQLHIMRDRRNEELRGSKYAVQDQNNERRMSLTKFKGILVREKSNSKPPPAAPFTPVKAHPDSKSYERSDFVRKPIENVQISYRTAKQKLRVAVQEYYRELEYLKSFSILNRAAFRKLNKKYERTLDANAKPTFRWFNENVDPAHFVTSNLIEEYIEAAEDLYTRYFERGNHKLAVGKLRELTRPHGDKSGSALINGLLVGIGIVFAVEGVWDGIERLHSGDEKQRVQTAFLLQIYAGYFLALYLFTLFCICCRVWTAYKVNYPFVFEFDTRHHLDWRQLSNFPCIFWLCFGVAMWFNFGKWFEFGNKHLYLWYPVILIGGTLATILLPLPMLRWRSRKWFAIAHWRLICSGFYPVEFRDFLLGDMYCSLVYAVANAEVFFCLYITRWGQPMKCGMNFSRVYGALAALPAFWRSMQCVRRFIDTRNAFPHLANLVKYLLTIGVAISLAMFRIDNHWVEREIYIIIAVITSVYTSIWDVFMDFSLLQEGARYKGLRNVLAFDMPWLYYSIIIIDPVLRFGWMPLVVFTHNLKRATIVAFTVALIEVTRRGMWTLFRVENEHCSNIGHLKASRDVPLPYKVIATKEEIEAEERASAIELGTMSPSGPRVRVEHEIDMPLMEAGQVGNTTHKFRRGGTLGAFSRMLAEAHSEDFQKKKKRGSEDGTEEGAVHGSRREVGIELALQEDESDGEMDEVSEAEEHTAAVRVVERELEVRDSIDSMALDQQNLISSPERTVRFGK